MTSSSDTCLYAVWSKKKYYSYDFFFFFFSLRKRGMLCGKERSVLDVQAAKPHVNKDVNLSFYTALVNRLNFSLSFLWPHLKKKAFWKIRDGARNNYKNDLRAWKLPCSEIFKEISLFTLSKRCLRSDLITAYLHREKISGALKELFNLVLKKHNMKQLF